MNTMSKLSYCVSFSISVDASIKMNLKFLVYIRSNSPQLFPLYFLREMTIPRIEFLDEYWLSLKVRMRSAYTLPRPQLWEYTGYVGGAVPHIKINISKKSLNYLFMQKLLPVEIDILIHFPSIILCILQITQKHQRTKLLVQLHFTVVKSN